MSTIQEDEPEKRRRRKFDNSEQAWRDSVIRRTAYYLFDGQGRIPSDELDSWIAAGSQNTKKPNRNKRLK